ncbi:FG-GAP repeat domain-containing protein [Fulvivirga sedimenti]|uniref:VCBS repeat-containing protein n=1 Tax=Fulvivirga sedimenti TaxID=2879465 RepID=A0A9X1HQ86_9BACT|nr:VCBS repeat-containing protein [Fulvivirga sedimenti]MCA6075141.1 VCBS repeat-containing protein [Fulvivirga sedimenti]MCA6076318.1 VCBS repeat-containing protein [Fulvivirga sedimenti]MCA6077446.1 VCBS repeat-containing protein [Fulvivirga sedimenti]
MKYLTTLSLIILTACSTPETNTISKRMLNLWSDQTSAYLPETSEWTNRAEAADLNGDGNIDIIFANGGNYSEPGEPEYCRIFLNQGSEKPFKEITQEVFGEEKYHARVAKAMDLNGDGNTDIFIGTTFQSQSQLLLGTGDGDFMNVTSTHLPQKPASIGDIEFGDVDKDGDLDVVLADWGAGNNMENEGGRTMLWLNDGEGKFTDVTETRMPDLLIRFSWDLEFIDFDNDFDLDVVISCKRCATSRLFENDGTGNFTNRRGIPAYTNNYEFEVMDVDGDGFMDLVTVNDGDIVGPRSYSRREHLFLNDSGKYFIDATQTHWPPSENIGEDDNNIVFLDFDSDGDPDFLLSSLTGEDRLLVNDGEGHFTLEQPVMKGEPTPHTLSLILADLNNDNKPDIIMGQGEGDSDLDERIFMADSLGADTAIPRVGRYRLKRDSVSNTVRIDLRIHDNKSPSMPGDWSTVNYQEDNADKGVMTHLTWYGEYLWYMELPNDEFKSGYLCATDRAGNKRCVRIINR